MKRQIYFVAGIAVMCEVPDSNPSRKNLKSQISPHATILRSEKYHKHRTPNIDRLAAGGK